VAVPIAVLSSLLFTVKVFEYVYSGSCGPLRHSIGRACVKATCTPLPVRSIISYQ